MFYLSREVLDRRVSERFLVEFDLAIDRLEFRVRLSEPLFVISSFEFGDLLVTDSDHHLAPLAVVVPIRVVVLKIPRDHLGTLFYFFSFLERVICLDIAEMKCLRVVRVVGIDRRDLVFLLDERDAIDICEFSDRIQKRCPTNTAADDDQFVWFGNK